MEKIYYERKNFIEQDNKIFIKNYYPNESKLEMSKKLYTIDRTISYSIVLELSTETVLEFKEYDQVNSRDLIKKIRVREITNWNEVLKKEKEIDDKENLLYNARFCAHENSQNYQKNFVGIAKNFSFEKVKEILNEESKWSAEWVKKGCAAALELLKESEPIIVKEEDGSLQCLLMF